jgi:hypothetical protein
MDTETEIHNYVEDYMEIKTKLKNGWLLSIGFIDIDFEYKNMYITVEELNVLLFCMAKIINDFGVPQIGASFHDESNVYQIKDVDYIPDDKENHLHISLLG